MMFQSSPGPKAGCYLFGGIHIPVHVVVSILTRPESRMLHVLQAIRYRSINVSILTRPESRMLQLQVGKWYPVCKVSILTRPESRMLLDSEDQED